MQPIRFGWQVVVVVGLTPGLGCLISFDGYTGTDGGEAGSGADSSGGDGATGGSSLGGTDGEGGASGTATGGKGGSLGTGGDTATGGKGGTAGDPATGGDTATGGKGGTGGDTSKGGASGTSGATSGGTTSKGGGAGMSGATSGGTAGSGGSGGSGGMMPECPANGRGPAMVEISKPSGGFFCIDGTEVTNAMYQAFLATGPSVNDQDMTLCDWNMNFAPEMGATCDPLPATTMNTPVACVDWCDAKKFCEWAGRHLCGTIGGGASPPASYDNEATDEWYRTCTHAGDHILPYGDMMEGTYCVGYQYGVIHPVNVATVANCQGGYDGVWDMSGNVSEWTDTCSAASGPADQCAHRGGSWYDLKAGAPLYCNSSQPSDTTPMPEVLRRDTRDIHVGFRCCADP